ncbi:MAG: MBL fold metallo-hydrolase [bacterium]|nr:MBL fold metallo-hydrolase [bacterium]
MSLRVCVLGSSSSGNAAVVRGPQGALLVDAGLGARELGRRLAAVECDVDELVGVVLTHSHADHVRGAGVVARRLGLPVWLSRGTARETLRIWRGGERLVAIRAGERFQAAGIDIDCWACPHDTAEPLQFGFQAGGASVAFCTDLGHVTPEVLEELAGRQVLIVEANHDRERLLAGAYPAFLKRRITGGRGHLSNEQCADLLAQVAGPHVKHVVLAHLSRDNNRPDLARAAVGKALAETEGEATRLSVADPDRPGPWLDVHSGNTC